MMHNEEKKYYFITDLKYRYHGIQLKEGLNEYQKVTYADDEYSKFVFNSDAILYEVNKFNKTGYLWDLTIPPGYDVNCISEDCSPQFECGSIILTNPRKFNIDLLVELLLDKSILLTKTILSDIFECFISIPEDIEKIVNAVYKRGIDFDIHDKIVLYHLIRTGYCLMIDYIETTFGKFPTWSIRDILECAAAFGQINIIDFIANGPRANIVEECVDSMYSAAIRRDQIETIEYLRMCEYRYKDIDRHISSLRQSVKADTLRTLLDMDSRWSDPEILKKHKFDILYCGSSWLIRHFIDSGVNYADREDMDKTLSVVLRGGFKIDRYIPILTQIGYDTLTEHAMKIYMMCLTTMLSSYQYLIFLHEMNVFDIFDPNMNCHITEDMMIENDWSDIFRLYIRTRPEALKLSEEKIRRLLENESDGIINLILESDYVQESTRDFLETLLQTEGY